jgi:hypothetical protein
MPFVRLTMVTTGGAGMVGASPTAHRWGRCSLSCSGASKGWAADVAESHTTYPTLVRLRSARPLSHWLTSLVAVMGAAGAARRARARP